MSSTFRAARLVSFLAAGLGLTLHGESQTAERHHPDFSELSARWAGALEELEVPGMALVVVEGDSILHLEAFGLRDVDSRQPVTPDTQFYIASATKPFIAFAAKQLEEQGRLDLGAPVRSYLPRLELAQSDVARTMTVRDLLCHKPGLQSSPIVFLDAYTGEITEERYYHFLSDVVPSGRVTYSNLHFTLVGRVLEAVEEHPWKKLLERLIFEPAGMQRTTGFADSMYADENVALPTVWADGAMTTSLVRKTDSTMHAAGGLGTTVADLGRWLRIHLNGGMLGATRLLSTEGVEDLLTQHSRSGTLASRGLTGFGLGWMLGEAFGERKAQHGGGYVGASALITFLPELGLGVAVLTNTDVAGNALCKLVTDDVFALLLAEDTIDELPRHIQQWKRFAARESSASPESENPGNAVDQLTLEPGAYVGDYSHPMWGTLRIALAGEHLQGRMGNLRFSLHATGVDEFIAFAQGSLDAECSFRIKGGEVVAIRGSFEGHSVVFQR